MATDAGERVDVVLGRHLAALSRRKARELALRGKVRLNDARVAPSHRVAAGDVLTLDVGRANTDAGLQPAILAVTPRVVYVDKPAGWHVHDLRMEGHSVAAWLESYHPECAAASPDRREGGAVHRLDAPTSGVVAFARDPSAYQVLRQAFADGLVRKRYLAVCERGEGIAGADPHALSAAATRDSTALALSRERLEDPVLTAPEGALPGWLMTRELEPDEHAELQAICRELGHAPPRGPVAVIRAPLGPAAGQKLVTVRLDGRRAHTRALWLKINASRALALLWLDTGERHQLRAHLSWAGMPICGDQGYHGADFERLCLHAYLLDLSKAIDGERPVLSPPPQALLDAMQGALLET